MRSSLVLENYEDLNLGAKDYLINELDKRYHRKYNDEEIIKKML